MPTVGLEAEQADAAVEGYGRSSLYGPVYKMADDECEHGRLPGDRTDPCGCFTEDPSGDGEGEGGGDLPTALRDRIGG